jgi:pimeloyl-ACP methyl ester carboxylesterase
MKEDIDLEIDWNHLSWPVAWWHFLTFYWLIFALYVVQKNKKRQFFVYATFLGMTSVVAMLSTNLREDPPIYYSITLFGFSLVLLAIVKFNKISKKSFGPPIFWLLFLLQLGVVSEDYCKFLDYPVTSKPFEGEILNVEVLYTRTLPEENPFDGHYKMHITCRGKGKHLVLLEPGIPFTSASLSGVAQKISEKYSNTTVCTYDRLGYGWSEATVNPRTTLNMINELRSLLAAARLNGKRVAFVGWSFGGLIAQLYGRLFPGEMLGLVLVDSMDHHVLIDDLEMSGAIETGKQMFTLSKILTPIGFMRLVGFLGLLPPECGYPLSHTLLPSESAHAMRALYFSQSQFQDTAFDELHDLKLSLNQTHDLLGIPEKVPFNMPTVILRGNVSISPAYLKSHKRLLRTSAKKIEKISYKSDHYIPMRDPDAIVDALQALFILRRNT